MIVNDIIHGRVCYYNEYPFVKNESFNEKDPMHAVFWMNFTSSLLPMCFILDLNYKVGQFNNSKYYYYVRYRRFYNNAAELWDEL